MASSFFNGGFFNSEFFYGSTVKKGSNWKSKRKQDEQVIIAFLHAYMQEQQSLYGRCQHA